MKLRLASVDAFPLLSSQNDMFIINVFSMNDLTHHRQHMGHMYVGSRQKRVELPHTRNYASRFVAQAGFAFNITCLELLEAPRIPKRRLRKLLLLLRPGGLTRFCVNEPRSDWWTRRGRLFSDPTQKD